MDDQSINDHMEPEHGQFLNLSPNTREGQTPQQRIVSKASSVEAHEFKDLRRTQEPVSSSPSSPTGRLEPPITTRTLSQLDVDNVVFQDPKLRHDISFDPTLRICPNLHSKERQKRQDRANQFWTTLHTQLKQFTADPIGFQQHHGQEQEWCLPMLLRSVRDIIQTLVPQLDHVFLNEGFNVELIMQQLHRGMIDLGKLASWLPGFLKSHCAPMRDEWVDDVFYQLTNDNQTNDMEEFVQGMRGLLSVLEAMKLDIANHHLRCLRPALIEDATQFERRHFFEEIQNGKLVPQAAQQWYAAAKHEHQHSIESKAAFGDMDVFFKALSRLILPSSREQPPNTFFFDKERILKLRADVLDAINLEVCMRLYEELEKKYRTYQASIAFAPLLATTLSGASGSLPPASNDEDMDGSFPWNQRTPLKSSLVLSPPDSTGSSKLSKVILSYPPPTTADVQTRSWQLYSSLLALLQSTSLPPHQWKAMKESLALQILRFTNAPLDDLHQFEKELEQHLCEPESQVFQDVERQFHKGFMDELQQWVKEMKLLTGAKLFSVATSDQLHRPGRTWDRATASSTQRDRRENLRHDDRKAHEDGNINDMAKRLAHLGLLHWRVWSPLVYNDELPDAETADAAAQ